MKLSELKIRAEDEERGDWVHLGGDAYLRLRMTTYQPYQRALRRRELEKEEPLGAAKAQKSVDDRLADEDEEDAALHALRGEHILADWFGVDEEAAQPVELNGSAQREVVGVCDGVELERWACDGKTYRKLEDGRYVEQQAWTKERSIAAMCDRDNKVLRNLVKYRADLLTVEKVNKATSILGKSRTRPSGKPSTPTSSKP